MTSYEEKMLSLQAITAKQSTANAMKLLEEDSDGLAVWEATRGDKTAAQLSKKLGMAAGKISGKWQELYDRGLLVKKGRGYTNVVEYIESLMRD